MLRGSELSAGPSHLISAVRCFTLNLSGRGWWQRPRTGPRSNVRAHLDGLVRRSLPLNATGLKPGSHTLEFRYAESTIRRRKA
jgi:hypothetical protein